MEKEVRLKPSRGFQFGAGRSGKPLFVSVSLWNQFVQVGLREGAPGALDDCVWSPKDALKLACCVRKSLDKKINQQTPVLDKYRLRDLEELDAKIMQATENLAAVPKKLIPGIVKQIKGWEVERKLVEKRSPPATSQSDPVDVLRSEENRGIIEAILTLLEQGDGLVTEVVTSRSVRANR